MILSQWEGAEGIMVIPSPIDILLVSEAVSFSNGSFSQHCVSVVLERIGEPIAHSVFAQPLLCAEPWVRS